MKRMKDKAFARAVPREDIRKGAEELGLPLETHITNVIGFLRERADDWACAGQFQRKRLTALQSKRKAADAVSE